MEQEVFLSGYCRCLDGSRMVELIIEDGKLTEIDCAYPTCPHKAACNIAKEIERIAAT